MVYTLVAPLLKSCPDGAPDLGIKSQSPLRSDGKSIIESVAGATIQFDFAQSSSSVPGPIRAVVFSGLGAKMLDYVNGHVTLPEDLQGWSFIILTNAENIASVTAANTVAGPAEINVPFNAFQDNSGFAMPSAPMSSGGNTTMPGSSGSGSNTTMPGQAAGGQESSSGGNSTMPGSSGSGRNTTMPGQAAGGGGGESTSSPICRANQCNTSSDCGRSNNPFSSRRCTQGTRINGRQCGRVCVGI
jgi:hypothetical protein